MAWFYANHGRGYGTLCGADSIRMITDHDEMPIVEPAAIGT